MSENNLCSDCPPADYPTDKTRCLTCPRRRSAKTAEPERPLALKADHERALKSAMAWAPGDGEMHIGPNEQNLAIAYVELSRAGADREAELVKALAAVLSDIADYEHLNGFAVSLGWDSVTKARAALSPQEQDDGQD